MFIRWPSGEQAAGISTLRRCQLTHNSYLLSHGKPRITSNLSSKSNTMEPSSYWTSLTIWKIPTTRFITVTDAPVARCTVILDVRISHSIYLSLLLSSNWRCTKLFDAPQSTRARSGIFSAPSSFKVMRKTSLPEVATHND